MCVRMLAACMHAYVCVYACTQVIMVLYPRKYCCSTSQVKLIVEPGATSPCYPLHPLDQDYSQVQLTTIKKKDTP